ncbi:class A beta-lactamase [Pseudonocardia eucalypti]|uniref:class A beta-lactamase n=1 Tax=Pseudonocardia eucalypti TaxID=648755 RepID=UPI003CD0A628
MTAAFLAAALTACAGPAPTTASGRAPTAASGSAPAPSPAPAPRSPSAPAPAFVPGPASTPGAAAAAERAEFERLELDFDARLGLYAVDTATGREITFRADERFGYASTHKAFSAAAVLQRTPLDQLDRVVTYRQSDVVSDSPITAQHASTGMTLRAIMDATLRYSDNTGGNLLFRELGGPAGLAAALRAVGDTTSQVDRIEPDLNRVTPGDLRDTSTPRALANTLRAFTLGDALTPDKRKVLVDMMCANTTGNTDIRAGVPAGWLVADKTGSADYGTRNDIAVLWPPNRPPIVIAVLTDRKAKDDKYDNKLLAQATTAAVKALGAS